MKPGPAAAGSLALVAVLATGACGSRPDGEGWHEVSRGDGGAFSGE